MVSDRKLEMESLIETKLFEIGERFDYWTFHQKALCASDLFFLILEITELPCSTL